MKRASAIALYTIAILIGVAGASLFNLPATLLAKQLASSTNGQVMLTNVRGKVFEGRGDATVKLPNSPVPLAIPNLRWQLRFWPLLTGEAVLDLQSDGPQIRGKAIVVAGFGRQAVRDAQVEFPAQVITAHVPQAQGWTSPGKVQVRSSSLSIDADGIDGAAEALWQGAHADGLGELGEYRATMKGTGKGPAKIDLATLKGALRLTGSGQFAPPGALRMGVDIDFQGPQRDQILPLLGMLGGNQRPDGTVAVVINTQAPARPAPGRPS